MTRFTFKIREMDCSEEIAILKKVLIPVLGEEKFLHFDLLENKLSVQIPDGRGITEDFLIKTISGTGMKAEPFTAGIKKSHETVKRGSLRISGRSILFLSSGLFLISGFLIHAFTSGFTKAFTGDFPEAPGLEMTAVRVLYILAALTGGRYIFPKAFFALRNLRPDMNLLMTIAAAGAFVIGEWFEGAFVIFLFSLALLLESWSIKKARNAIRALMELKPVTAKVKDIDTGEISEKPVDGIPPDTHIVIGPGEKIPLDGTVVSGGSHIDQRAITGESMPVYKSINDSVFAGTINTEGLIEIRSTRTVNDTTLARIIDLVEKARSKRALAEQWVDRFAAYYTPAMIFLALIIATAPPLIFNGEWMKWIYEALVILVIGCPCALVISTPVSIVAALTTASRMGILIKGGIFLEMLSEIKVIAFDKTGTLTYGNPSIKEIISLNNHSAEDILRYASSLEIHSSHPVARAIVSYTRQQKIDFKPAEDFKLKMGMGAEGTINGHTFCIGNSRLMKHKGLDTEEYFSSISEMEEKGITAIALCEDDHICGIIGISDEVREDARKTVEELRDSGIGKIVMLTGDNEKTAAGIAELTGIDDYRSGLFPEEKADVIVELMGKSGKTAMIGDGINDAPAMATASIGIAMGGIGSDAAIETADITLMSDNIEKLPWLIRHSGRTLAIIRQNIVFALGLKLAFVALAVGGIATLWMAIAADMGASLLVIFNSLRLLKNNDSGDHISTQ
ncbi:heavy metal translocating P-type ATPase [candidate division KSB1 bacterium]